MSATRLPYPHPTSAAVSKVMRANKKTGSKPEVRVRSLLHRQGFRFRKNHRIDVDGLRVRPDIVFSRARLAVFIDGCFWHRCPNHGFHPRSNTLYWTSKLDRNVERDQAVNRALSTGGWRVVRIWEHVPPDEAAFRIATILTGKPGDPGHRL